MQRRRWILLFAFLAVIVLAIVYAFLPRPVPVEIAQVVRGPLEVTVQEEGKTRVVDRYTLSSPVAGVARRIDLHVGDGVSRGQVLVEVEPAPPPFLDLRRAEAAQARVEAAKASLEAARARARIAEAREPLARSRFERTKALHAAGSASRDALEAAESEFRQDAASLRSSEFAVRVAASDLEAARAELLSATGKRMGTANRFALRSPVEGSVLAVFHRSRGAVREGEPLLEIGQPRSLEVEVDVLSTDAVRIRPGSQVRFTRWGGEKTLEGRVRTVEPEGFTKVSALGVEEQRVLVIADIVSPKPEWEGLGDRYRVEATFVLWRGENILQVPTAALFRRGDGWAVYAVDGGRARLRPVQVGRQAARSAQVLSGLAEGQPVIVHPSDQLRDGARVRRRQGPA